jgi:diaminopimelate decarboxylase
VSLVSERMPAEHAPMTQFPVESGQLVVGGMPLARLAARVGQTPFYACDRAVLRARAEALRGALPPAVHLHYAMKANPMPALVGHMLGLVDGVDVASAGELKIALDAGADPRTVSLTGPGKRQAEIVQAVAAGVLVNIESARETALLAAASQALGVAARVGIRLNPDFELRGAGMRMGGGAKPFGIDVEQVPAVLRDVASAGLVFEGFHVFGGSQNLQPAAIAEALRSAYELVLRLAPAAPAAPRVLNLGGGFGLPYFPGDQHLDLAPIGEALAALCERASRELPGARLTLELGRYLVGEAGVYVCRVLDRKLSRGQVFLVTDGGLHHHLAASGNFGQVLRKNYPLAIGTRMDAPRTGPATVTGPLCTPLDVLAERLPLPDAQEGDLVVVFLSGAYGASASPERFLGHPACAEVLV